MDVKKNSKRTSEYHGVLLVDKPAGITSHDVVDRIRKIFGTRRVGHIGTLDPQATGLLVLLLGEATKISEYLVGCDKSYEGTMQFGVVSDTYDKEGDVRPGPGKPIPTTLEEIQDEASRFTGETMQYPPPYSAKKIAGKKLYEYAREGRELPKIEPREVRIDDLEIISLNGDLAEFGMDCSSGTYVRSLVHDMGQRLGCGAILTELRRTDVGGCRIEEAKTLEQLEALDAEGRKEVIRPIRLGLKDTMTIFYLVPQAEQWLRRGQAIPHNMVHTEDDERPGRGSLVLLCRLNGHEVAVARVDPAPLSPPPKAFVGAASPWYQPLKLFEM